MIYFSVVLKRKADILGPLHDYLVKEKNNFFFFLFFLKECHSHLRQRASSEMLKRCETTNFNWKFNIFYHASNNNPLAKNLLLVQLLWVYLVCGFVGFSSPDGGSLKLSWITYLQNVYFHPLYWSLMHNHLNGLETYEELLLALFMPFSPQKFKHQEI